jgi:hypothetical protein
MWLCMKMISFEQRVMLSVHTCLVSVCCNPHNMQLQHCRLHYGP